MKAGRTLHYSTATIVLMHRVLGSMSDIYIRDGQDKGESVENWKQPWWILKACKEEALAEALENGDLDGEDPALLP